MAAVADVQTVNITINDIPLAVPKGELIVESIKRVGLDVPIFCYHPRMAPVGMCRMCLVEMGSKGPDGSVRMFPKPQTACSLPASEGLVIKTDTDKVHQDRKGVLEFLLINHPLDCPICDRGGECPLQNNTLFYGPSTSRYIEVKRHAPKAFPLSKHVTLDLERCIQCGRCVRFTEEISGDGQLAFRFRGARMQPSTFELREFTSKFSGNVIEICPVGALTNTDYRFRARPWDLQARPGLCTNCGNGCNVFFDYRGTEMVRVNGRTNEDVNEEWTCDRGKFGHGYYNSELRTTHVLVRKGDELVPSDWPDAYAKIAKEFAGGAVAAIGGSRNSNEDLFMLRRLFTKVFGSDNLDHRTTRYLPTEQERLAKKFGREFAPSTIASFESRNAMLLFGTSLADDAPILYLRIRKAWLRYGAKLVVAHHEPTDADKFANVVLRYKPGTEATLAAGLAAASGVKGADSRMTPDAVEQATGVPAPLLTEAANLLKGSEPAIVTTHSLYNVETGPAAQESLVGMALGLEGTYDFYPLNANDAGASLLGFEPVRKALDTRAILQGCIDGSVKALWLLGIDPFKEIQDRELVTKALENVGFLVVQDIMAGEAVNYASVVLPATAPAEAEGTWTNIEHRVQHFGQVLPPKGAAKPAWLVASDLIGRLAPEAPVFNAADVMALIAAENPQFKGCSYASLGLLG
jgi:NADH-quinone oxidoreductase subunit G